ncbi:MAG: hypothetical protein Q4P18_07415 [Methanobrevibacter sp.]|uniref:hypothetical protein n=1 Tax=Methanobrevibacter sp. TaxID=66852 RepID=UPI0026DEC875|nr:hypothetical protein [Methanobrevibacter sp.]MDO5849347.1 hypothetical protein [Methanobrevibacter sp.]
MEMKKILTVVLDLDNNTEGEINNVVCEDILIGYINKTLRKYKANHILNNITNKINNDETISGKELLLFKLITYASFDESIESLLKKACLITNKIRIQV